MSIKTKLCVLLTVSAIAGCGENKDETPIAVHQPTPSIPQTQPPVVVQQSAPNNTMTDMLIGGMIGHTMANATRPAVVEKHYIQTPPAPRYIQRAPVSSYRSISSGRK